MEALNPKTPDKLDQLPPEYVDDDGFHSQKIGRFEASFLAESGTGLTLHAETRDGTPVYFELSPRELLALVKYATDNQELLGRGSFKDGRPFPEPDWAPVDVRMGNGPEPIPTNKSIERARLEDPQGQ